MIIIIIIPQFLSAAGRDALLACGATSIPSTLRHFSVVHNHNDAEVKKKNLGYFKFARPGAVYSFHRIRTKLHIQLYNPICLTCVVTNDVTFCLQRSFFYSFMF